MTDDMRLPYDADWIVDGRICAMPLPDEASIRVLGESGFTAVVTVASEMYADSVVDWCRMSGVRHLRYRVPDMAPPEPHDVRDFVAEVDCELRRDGCVAVHCLAGVGRTGTMIACYLVAQGAEPEDAIAEVRRRRPGSVQTRLQELCIVRYAAELQRSGGRPRRSRGRSE